jgi:hypothetical protein
MQILRDAAPHWQLRWHCSGIPGASDSPRISAPCPSLWSIVHCIHPIYLCRQSPGADRRIQPPVPAPALVQLTRCSSRRPFHRHLGLPFCWIIQGANTRIMLPLHAPAQTPLLHFPAPAQALLLGHSGCPSMPHSRWASPGLPRVR